MRINGLQPLSHFGQSFGAAHPGAGPCVTPYRDG
jgi:hypothetical protein